MKFLATLLLLALAVAALTAWAVYTPIGPALGTSDQAAAYVDIAPGTGTRAIAAKLEAAGVLRSRYVFDLLRAVKGGRLVAGEYRFNRPATAIEVYDRMARGDVYSIPLTIPEGYNIFQVAQAVEAAGLGPSGAFLAAERSDTGLIADLAPNAPSLEGYLFPDTYRFGRHATPAQMLGAMVHRFRQVAAHIGLTPAGPGKPTANTVILASLIEKEVSQNTERPLVASVFINRLALRIPLATDPSVIYAAMLAGRYSGAIHASDLQFDSPYNTYLHTGLPPGPICNPGVAALSAALNPAQTGYLYFVADAQGHSVFSTTLKQHSVQVQAYLRALHPPTLARARRPPAHSRTPRSPAHSRSARSSAHLRTARPLAHRRSARPPAHSRTLRSAAHASIQ